MFGSTKWNHVAARLAVLGSFVVIMLLWPQHSGAVSPGSYQGNPCYQNECLCVPNMRTWGYYPATWREWPGEARPDKTFPQSINREALPTPQGTEIVAPPPAAQKPAPKAKAEGGGIQIPFEIGPGGKLQMKGQQPPGEQPKVIMPGAPGGVEQPMPGPSPGLPGGGLPGLPGGGLPGLPSEPAPGPGGTSPPTETTPPTSAPSPETTPPGEAKPSSDGAPSAASPPMPKCDSHAALLGLLKMPDRTAPANRREEEMTAAAPEPETSPEPETAEPQNAQASNGTQIRLSDPEARRLKTFLVPPDQTSPVKSSRYAAAGSSSEGECLLAAVVQQAASGDSAVRQVSYESETEPPAPDAGEKPSSRPPQAQPVHTDQSGWRRNDPPLALGGYCCVTLVKNESWVKGNPRWSAEHKGRTYLFASAVQRECFLVDPDRYIPACSGNDPVALIDKNVHVPGQLNYCVTYDGHLYMFSSAATLARFRQAPDRYLAAMH